MSDIKLYKLGESGANEVTGQSVALEKSLQSLIEFNLETLLGVRFLASEFVTDRDHGGRMDTLGIDENNCPVIIEYKRSANANVINQGLFYLDWLVTHRGDFEMLVLKRLGEEAARSVEWSSPRLICIAGGFNKFDEHAIKQMQRNIELVRYIKFDDDLLLLEQINSVSVAPPVVVRSSQPSSKVKESTKYTTVSEYLEKADQDLTDRFHALKDFLGNLGDDVQEKTLKNYFAFRRIKNFACVEVKPQDRKLLVYLKVNPDEVALEPGFTRDVRKIGHFGTGDLEVVIRSDDDLAKAMPLVANSYHNA